MTTNNEINKYIKEIKKQLLYGTKESKQLLKELKQNITDYVEENQGADMAQVMEQFGKPEDIATTFFEQYNKEEIEKKIKIRKAVVICAVAVVFIFVISMINIILDSHIETHGVIIESKATISSTTS